MEDIEQDMSNMNINENDQKIYASIVEVIKNNLDNCSDYIVNYTYHNEDEIETFIECVKLNMQDYLSSQDFLNIDHEKYKYHPQEFKEVILSHRQILNQFIINYVREEYIKNLQNIYDINSELLDFINHHYFVTGLLRF